MRIDLLKCHGSGNDFFLIDEFSNGYGFTEQQRVHLSQMLCDRNGAFGADGILFFQKSSCADAKMRIFNADGSEAEMCGNGIRCIARYTGELLNKNVLTVETIKGLLTVAKTSAIYEDIPTFQVDIQPISFELGALPMAYETKCLIGQPLPRIARGLTFTAMSLSNPHLVMVVDQINTDLLVDIAAKISLCPDIFPKGINISMCQVMEKNTIFVLTHERGVGLTNSCGTGMAASSLTTCLLGLNSLNETITVLNKGGMVRCQVKRSNSETYSVALIGNASYIYTCCADIDLAGLASGKQPEKSFFTGEINDYEKLVSYCRQKTNEIV